MNDTDSSPNDSGTARPRDFVRDIVARHVEEGRYPQIVTRFPPEPNGYPTIGHAKAICLSFGIAEEFGGVYNLRFDDTNPETEEMQYVEAFVRDIKWLGFDWGDRMFFASDYFEQLYEFALVLVDKGLAYVDSSTDEEIREERGSVTEPGRNSRYRDRTVDQNRDLLERMRAGEFADGAHVLRAKIDMAHNNMVMRDPILWRIRHATHYRRGDEWCIYPLYDFTHGLSDAIEGISHSICTLEFENNREIYDWLVDNVGFEEPRPHQYEFARLFLEYTVVSKRMLLRLVNEGHVSGWDDPRMPTLAALRRRGVTPEAIRNFCDMIGVTKANTRIDYAKFEFAIRDDLNRRVPRVMAVSDPLKVVITNWTATDEGVDWIDAPSYPHDVPLEGSRPVPFGRELWIERSDFEEAPAKGFYRMSPGAEVRLRYAYLVTCNEVVKDDAGKVVELRCTYDSETRGGDAPDGRKVRGTIHWVAAATALPCELRLYDRLFTAADPEDVPEGVDWIENLNPKSLDVRTGWIEPSVKDDTPGSRYQFERLGYFVADSEDSRPDALVFNRTVTLRDSLPAVAASPPVAATLPPVGVNVAASTPEVAHDPESAALAKDRAGDEAERFVHLRELGLAATDADVLARDPALTALFDSGYATGAAEPTALAKFVVNEVRPRLVKNRAGIDSSVGVAAATLVGLIEKGTATTRVARDVLETVLESGGDPASLVAERSSERVDDVATLGPLVDTLLAENPDKVEAFRGGKSGLMGFFVGQVMRQTGGKAAPAVVRALVAERLDS